VTALKESEKESEKESAYKNVPAKNFEQHLKWKTDGNNYLTICEKIREFMFHVRQWLTVDFRCRPRQIVMSFVPESFSTFFGSV